MRIDGNSDCSLVAHSLSLLLIAIRLCLPLGGENRSKQSTGERRHLVHAEEVCLVAFLHIGRLIVASLHIGMVMLHIRVLLGSGVPDHIGIVIEVDRRLSPLLRRVPEDIVQSSLMNVQNSVQELF